MSTAPPPSRRHRRRKLGCAIGLLILVVLGSLVFWGYGYLDGRWERNRERATVRDIGRQVTDPALLTHGNPTVSGGSLSGELRTSYEARLTDAALRDPRGVAGQLAALSSAHCLDLIRFHSPTGNTVVLSPDCQARPPVRIWEELIHEAVLADATHLRLPVSTEGFTGAHLTWYPDSPEQALRIIDSWSGLTLPTGVDSLLLSVYSEPVRERAQLTPEGLVEQD